MKHNPMEKLMEEYRNIPIPESGITGMKQAIQQAKIEKARRRRMKKLKEIGIGMAAALAFLVILPNVSANAAMAMEKMPVIGGLVDIITFGRYDFEDENHAAKVEIPKLEANQSQGTGIETINKGVEEYTTELVEKFKKDISENADGHQSLDIHYEVVTDTEKWFTLKLRVLETQASGFQSEKYYHINKETGNEAALKDLFKPDADYAAVISENIKAQMRAQMKKDENIQFFLDSKEGLDESDFKEIRADQNFYFDASGQLVLVFDEYEVAPGYMGIQQFTIPNDAISSIRV